MNFKVMINQKKFNSKPSGKEVVDIYHNLDIEQMDIHTLAHALKHGQTFRAAVVDKSLNFKSQQVFALDFDGVPFNSMMEIAEASGVFPAIVYPTFSQVEGAPLDHYRMIFVSDHVISDKRIRDAVLHRLMRLYDDHCDPKCRDTSRMFFGGRDVYISEEFYYNFEELWGIDTTISEGYEAKK